MGVRYFTYSHSLVPVIDLWISGRDKVGIRALIAIDENLVHCLVFSFHYCSNRLKIVNVVFLSMSSAI